MRRQEMNHQTFPQNLCSEKKATTTIVLTAYCPLLSLTPN